MKENLAICYGCLSSQRKLYPLFQLQPLLREICLWEMKSSAGSVCWECRSIMMRYAKFKAQVVKAQESLTHCPKIQDLTCLSTLKSCTNQTYIIQCHNKSDPLTDTKTDLEFKIKVEVVNEETTKTSTNNYEYDEEHKDDLFEDCDDEKPVIDTDVYAEILSGNMKEINKCSTKARPKIRKKLLTDTADEEELKQKFEMVVFTEEEMMKNREDKRIQPNFKKIPFKCDSCVLGFTRKDTYDMHMAKRHDKKIGPLTCPVCRVRFQTQKQVDRHTRKHYVCYRCRLCKYETLELWSAASHCRAKHGADSWRRIHCPDCEAVAQTPEELSLHMSAEHSILCSECGEKFKGPSTLRSHKRRIHGVKREFICDLCSKTFKTKSRLESHMVSHNDTLARKLAYCAPCDVQYKNIYVYRNHLKTSANHADQTYQCRDCNKKFASKVYWKKHYNFYHLHKSQFHCEICNKLFISDWRLKNHRQTQHGLSRSRDHDCNVCGKQFFTLSTLKGHQLTHSEQRSFMCEDCGDTFKQRPALYTHYKLVHKGVKRRRKL